MRSRIGTRVILAVGLITAVSIGLMAILIIGTHERQLIAERTLEADQFSETIKSSTHYDMLENRREGLHRQIENIGRQEGIERVRIFNKEGVVMFSSDAAEIGGSLDKHAEACYACHAEGRPLEKLPIDARTRLFAGANGHRVLGIINPIHNEPACSTEDCHAHSVEQSVLGVLDVTVSLARVDDQIAASRARMGGLALLTILAGGTLLWWLNRRLVVRPVEALMAGTRRVAEGDLTTMIPATDAHELGDLARAFNAMTRKLAEAQNQINQAAKLASVGRLAAGVAHEINNPLTGVLTYASFLLKRAGDRPELSEDLEIIVRETKRCREIVRGLLDFARQTRPDRKPTDLNETVRRAVAVVMNRLRLDQVSLDLELQTDLPPVPADANQVQQVLVNLLLNAVDAVGRNGDKVRVVSRRTSLAPWGHAAISHATCPSGCDLIDPEVRIRAHPALRVIRRSERGEALVHLDPVYGRFNHVITDDGGHDQEADHLCSRCRTSLDIPGVRCRRCGAGIFAVRVPGDGQVQWCRRSGCHWSRWETRDAAGSRPFVEILVEDTGCGIATADLTHVFEPFFSTKGPGGTGLGLAVTWGIVESHDGTIEVESELGQGSRFTVRLPLTTAEVATPTAA